MRGAGPLWTPSRSIAAPPPWPWTRVGTRVVPTYDDKGLSILDTRSGSLLHIIALDQGASGAEAPTGSMAVAVDTRRGHAFVANGDDASVSVLDVRTGAVLRTLAVGVHPLAV